MNRFRLPLAALSLALIGLLGACSNATGPSPAARSGYITSSSALQLATPTVAPVRNGTTTTTGTTVKSDSLPPDKATSGYNVPAY